MSTPALNLASRPFRNERLPALLLALGFTVAGAVTVKHALAIRDLLPGRTSGLARHVQELEEERARLRTEVARLRAPRPDPAAVAQWATLKELVDQRTLSWSGLFAVLEEVLPPGVRLVSVAPAVAKGQRTLDLSVVARSNEDALELIRLLEERPEFDDVLPRSRSGDAEMEFRLTMRYTPLPLPLAAAVAAAPPAPEPAAASPLPAAAGPRAPEPTPSPSPTAAPARPRAQPSPTELN